MFILCSTFKNLKIMKNFLKLMILSITLLASTQKTNAQDEVRVINNTGCSSYTIDINFFGGSLTGQTLNSTGTTIISLIPFSSPTVIDVTVYEFNSASSANLTQAQVTTVGTCSLGSTLVAWTATNWGSSPSYIEITIY